MRFRIAASVVLAAGILAGTSACGFYAPQATTIQYDASDGVSAQVGDIDIRNAILLSEDGDEANLIVTVVNRGDTARSLTVQYAGPDGKVDRTVRAPANSSTTLGTEDAPAVTVKNMDSTPGALFPIYFQYGDEPGAEILVPILDGTQEEYSSLLP